MLSLSFGSLGSHASHWEGLAAGLGTACVLQWTPLETCLLDVGGGPRGHRTPSSDQCTWSLGNSWDGEHPYSFEALNLCPSVLQLWLVKMSPKQEDRQPAP